MKVSAGGLVGGWRHFDLISLPPSPIISSFLPPISVLSFFSVSLPYCLASLASQARLAYLREYANGNPYK